MGETALDPLETLHVSLESYESALASCRSATLKSMELRSPAKGLVQQYFRNLKPHLISLCCDNSKITVADAEFQHLLSLANGHNKKKAYLTRLAKIRAILLELEKEREFRFGERNILAIQQQQSTINPTQRLISNALASEISQTTALSFEQAIRDLSDPSRISFRGTANELREVLRETLDKFAPDSQVLSELTPRDVPANGRPTQKQKMRYVLRLRRAPMNAQTAPIEALELIDELTASVTRATSERSSIATHKSPTRVEVRKILRYVETVLCELLEQYGA